MCFVVKVNLSFLHLLNVIMINLKSENNGKIILHDQQLKLIYNTKRRYQQKLISISKQPNKSSRRINTSDDSSSILTELKLNRSSKSNYENPEHYRTKEMSVGTNDLAQKSEINVEFTPPNHFHCFNLPVHNIHAEAGLDNFQYRRSSLRSSFDMMHSDNSECRNTMRNTARTKSVISNDIKIIKPMTVKVEEVPRSKYHSNSLERVLGIKLVQKPFAFYKALISSRPKSVGYISRSSFSYVPKSRKRIGNL